MTDDLGTKTGKVTEGGDCMKGMLSVAPKVPVVNQQVQAQADASQQAQAVVEGTASGDAVNNS